MYSFNYVEHENVQINDEFHENSTTDNYFKYSSSIIIHNYF